MESVRQKAATAGGAGGAGKSGEMKTHKNSGQSIIDASKEIIRNKNSLRELPQINGIPRPRIKTNGDRIQPGFPVPAPAHTQTFPDPAKEQQRAQCPEQLRKTPTPAGQITWEINRFSNLLSPETNGYDKRYERDGAYKNYIESLAFTEDDGYNMYVRLYPNGNGEDTNKYLSLYFGLEQGSNDEKLNWPFSVENHIITAELVSLDGGKGITQTLKLGSNRSFDKPTGSFNRDRNRDIPVAFPSFAPISALCKSKHVENDTIFIRVNVKKKMSFNDFISQKNNPIII